MFEKSWLAIFACRMQYWCTSDKVSRVGWIYCSKWLNMKFSEKTQIRHQETYLSVYYVKKNNMHHHIQKERLIAAKKVYLIFLSPTVDVNPLLVS